MNTIAGGDWRFFFPENIGNFIGIPSAWDASLNTGIGQPQLNTLWITGYLYFSSLLSRLGFSWNAISLFCWIIPIVILSFAGSYLLYRYFLDGDRRGAILSGVIYTSNTYFLMIFSGGQLGVCLSYSLVPLVVLRFLKNNKKPNVFNSVFLGLVLSFQILFDPRVAIVSGILLVAFLILGGVRNFFKNWKFTIAIPITIVCAIHGYWVLPILFFYGATKVNPAIYKRTNDFSFFSFATLENTLSLLHPNWPDNIFGKVYFMRPEFLIVPLLAFSSLLQKIHKQTKKIICLVLVGLVCAFLAKGSQDPFGIVYILLLKYVPGFSIFRDPTKFYIPIAVSYSLLIPFALSAITNYLKVKFKNFKNINTVGFAVFIIFWIILLRPVVMGQVGGIFRLKTVPSDYYNLKNYIANDPEFYRTLWVPSLQRYGYFSNNHPAIGRGEIFHLQSATGMIDELSKSGMEQTLSDLSVKYVIVPSDPEGEIFLKDHKYDPHQYSQVVEKISKIPYLKKEKTFGNIVVFKTLDYKKHFRFFGSASSYGIIKVLSQKPSEYNLSIIAKKGEVLIFGDQFDKNWVMITPHKSVYSRDYNGLNSFIMPDDGNYEIHVTYQPQKWVDILSFLSFLVIIAVILYLLIRTFYKKHD